MGKREDKWLEYALLAGAGYLIYESYKKAHPESNLPSGSPTDIGADAYATYITTAAQNPNYNLFDAAKNAFNAYTEAAGKTSSPVDGGVMDLLQNIAKGNSMPYVDLGQNWIASAPAVNPVLLPKAGAEILQDASGGLYSDIDNFVQAQAAPTAHGGSGGNGMAAENLTYKGYQFSVDRAAGETVNYNGNVITVRRADGTIREEINVPMPEPNIGSTVGGSSTNLTGAAREAARIARTRGLK